MRLNRGTDFALRIVMLLANEETPISVEEIAARLDLAKSHVMKIVARLGAAGIVETQRGRRGGVELARDPEHLSIGEVVRHFEPDFAVVDCLDPERARCVFEPRCALMGKMREATGAFLAVLDDTTLADIVARTQKIERAPA